MPAVSCSVIVAVSVCVEALVVAVTRHFHCPALGVFTVHEPVPLPLVTATVAEARLVLLAVPVMVTTWFCATVDGEALVLLVSATLSRV